MQFLDKWERKFGWLSFPGFLRYYAIFHVLVYLLQFVNPEIGIFLEFNRSKILAGEIWRLITFLFAGSGVGGQDAFGMLFLFFMVMLAFMISDALEESWGVFRASFFYYTGYIGLILANVDLWRRIFRLRDFVSESRVSADVHHSGANSLAGVAGSHLLRRRNLPQPATHRLLPVGLFRLPALGGYSCATRARSNGQSRGQAEEF